MEVTAKARFVRMGPRKVRLVADLVRGMDVEKAEAQLRFNMKAAARPVLKCIQSARANATHNHNLEGTLFVKTITVDGGPVLERWRARAFGRAAPIRKRSSHITVILAEREIGEKSDAIAKAAVKKTSSKKAASAKKTEAKPEKEKAEKKTEKKTEAAPEEKVEAPKEEAKESSAEESVAKND